MIVAAPMQAAATSPAMPAWGSAGYPSIIPHRAANPGATPRPPVPNPPTLRMSHSCFVSARPGACLSLSQEYAWVLVVPFHPWA